MKQLETVLIPALTAAIFVVTGCSSDSKNKNDAVAMMVGETLSVYPGDKITPGSEDTRISIRHEVGREIKNVTLLAGTAELVRGTYVP